MAQSLQIKKINSLPSTFEKGTVYFYPAQKQILLGLGSGSTEGTHYTVFKGTDTDTNTNVNGGATANKRYLLGASSTTATDATNTNANCYMQNGVLYSGGSQVLVDAVAASGTNINTVGTPSVTASTSNGKTTFTFNYLKGAKGDSGSNGTNGSTWYSGTSTPSASTGVVNDWYINTNTFDIYKKTAASTWTKQGNIKGTDGIDGINGIDGTNGTNGYSILPCSESPTGTGTNVAITRNTINNYSSLKVGDLVLCANGNLYTITAVATTCRGTYICSLKGPAGAPPTTTAMSLSSSSSALPLLFSTTAATSMTSGNGYNLGYNDITYTPTTGKLELGKVASSGSIVIGNTNKAGISVASDGTLTVNNPTHMAFSTESNGTTPLILGYSSLYPYGSLNLGLDDYPWTSIAVTTIGSSTTPVSNSYFNNISLVGTSKMTCNGDANYIQGSAETQMRVNGGVTTNLAVGGTDKVVVSDTAIYPNGTVTLGTQWVYWNKAYFGTHVYIGSSTSNYLTCANASSGITIVSSNGVKCATGFYETSDENLKEFKGEIPVDFEKLKQIPKQYFVWKSENEEKMHIGTSAQEIQKIYPELVSEDEKGELSVNYSKLSIVALRAIDELNDKCDELEKKNKELEERLCKLESLINIK